ncbi:TetR/AcrR family transcriptional regulator [Rhizobium sp. S152]|uniref:TetR/AcrR family transcriptional regulator n=1 Tax=Rhizobium sp. S152 TaxID=3055038 RepID=UPI0025A96487|nr:TetR/AcrR family transcriptional regulator [Rhizobium sp. S152]MDM9624731.1 TetR/AcrR family transcriptional regulator [Rhizobium sp. S152]
MKDNPESKVERATRPGGRSARVRENVRAAALMELRAKGFAGLSHRAIAARAEVDPSTVYRRWPTRMRLITDLIVGLSDHEISVPDTGDLALDLSAYLNQVIELISAPEIRALGNALLQASSDEDEDVDSALKLLWGERFARAAIIFDRAIDRGDLPAHVEVHLMIELLVAPTWFRILVSRQPLDDRFIETCVGNVMMVLQRGTNERGKS